MQTYNRNGLIVPPSSFEKVVILPDVGETDPCVFAFTDGRFAVDIMQEHAKFFVWGMPPELIKEPRAEAQAFHTTFLDLLKKIDALGVPKSSDLQSFCSAIIETIKPFNDYKQRMIVLQDSGTLRSTVWSSFMSHMSQEAVHWMNRLQQIITGDVAYTMPDAVLFGTDIIADHAQYTAHLLDPKEPTLIDAAFTSANRFAELKANCVTATELNTPYDVSVPLSDSEKELVAVTTVGQGVEAGKIKSIIDPVLADHVRRETLKIVDELSRVAAAS